MWKEINGYDGYYQVSNDGRVRSLTRDIIYKDGRKRQFIGTILKPRLTNGYKTVNLSTNKKQKTYQIHRLVANAFLIKPSYAQCVNHVDGNKLNNDVSNLEWCTYKHNNIHDRKIGLNNSKGENLLQYSEQQKKKVVMLDGEKIVTIKDCSRDMAIFVKDYLQLETKLETISRTIRQVCKQYEIGHTKIASSKRRKTAYNYTFKYFL